MKITLPYISLPSAFLVSVLLIAASVGAVVATPKLSEIENPPDLNAAVPREFGDWREVPSPYVQVSLSTGNEPNSDQPYDQTVMRSYVNSKGQTIMLALAWGHRQRQEVKVHRPDLCYVAQGYQVKSLSSIVFSHITGAGGPIVGKRMVATNGNMAEAVSYWMRIGSLYSEDALDTRMHIFKEGLSGRIPDGILVRASEVISGPENIRQTHELLEDFLTQLVDATPRNIRGLLVR